MTRVKDLRYKMKHDRRITQCGFDRLSIINLIGLRKGVCWVFLSCI